MNAEPTRYHLPGLDRHGIIFGLNIAQLIVVSIGFALTMFFLMATNAGIIVALSPSIVAFAIVKISFGGIPLLELVGPVIAGVPKAKRREWTADTNWTGTGGSTTSGSYNA